MKRPLQIGITGGIGSGKSLVCRIFHCLGVPVYDADNKAKDLMVTDRVLVGQIQKEFGPQAYFPGGQINRKYLAKKVFGNPEQLEKLNRMVHPRVLKDYTRWVAGLQDKPYVIHEAALIFEAGSSHDLNAVIMVSAPEVLRVKRVVQRDAHRTGKDIKNIINNQMPEEEKLRRADFVIVNDESRLVIPQVLKLHERFTAMD